MRDDKWIDNLLEEHVPKNGFRNRTQYRRIIDALGVIAIKKPDLYPAKLLEALQKGFHRSAQMMLEDLIAKKRGYPTEESPDVKVEDMTKTIEGTATKSEVIPYRKTG